MHSRSKQWMDEAQPLKKTSQNFYQKMREVLNENTAYMLKSSHDGRFYKVMDFKIPSSYRKDEKDYHSVKNMRMHCTDNGC